jgi:hypothetical protein
MITKVHWPDINLRVLHENLNDGMGTSGFGGGCVVGEVFSTGRLVQFFPRVKTVFPGCGTYRGGCNDDGRGYG